MAKNQNFLIYGNGLLNQIRLKQFITLIVLIIVIISTIGYIGFLKINLYLIHKEMKYEIMSNSKHRDSITLIIKKDMQNVYNSFVKIHSREFRYKGEMYDVISEYDSADVSVFICIHDVEESNLLNVFAEIIKSDNSNENRNKLNNFPNIFNFYYVELSYKISCIFYNVVKYLSFTKDKIINQFYLPESPPPVFIIL